MFAKFNSPVTRKEKWTPFFGHDLADLDVVLRRFVLPRFAAMTRSIDDPVAHVHWLGAADVGCRS